MSASPVAGTGMANGLVEQLNRIVWDDEIERRGLPGRIVSTTMRYLYAVLRDLMTGPLNQRAMSLVYTTLFRSATARFFRFAATSAYPAQ